jgi:hypothetical protein
MVVLRIPLGIYIPSLYGMRIEIDILLDFGRCATLDIIRERNGHSILLEYNNLYNGVAMGMPQDFWITRSHPAPFPIHKEAPLK